MNVPVAADGETAMPAQDGAEALRHRSSAASEPVRPRLSWNRLDLAIKLRHLESVSGLPSTFADGLYDEHLRAMTSGAEGIPWQAEPGLPRSDFADMYHRLREEDPEVRPLEVVLASDGSVLTGAHQAACALMLDRPVQVLRTEQPPAVYDHRFFRQRGLSDEHLDAAALHFVERAPDSFVALVWPAAQGSDAEIEAILGPLVHAKAVSLTSNGAHNLLSQVYAGEPWLGDPERNYPGIQHKLVQCFARSGPLRVLIFQSDSLEKVLSAKQAVRDRFGLGKHSIHITDTHPEAVMVARLLLNDRSVHFLNVARPMRFASTLRMATGFKDYLRRRGVPPDMALVDSGMVLAAYGLREAQDVDFLSPFKPEAEGLFSHHGPGAHGVALGELLHDPRNHVHYWGLKFVSLDQVARMKRRRKEGRDLDDLGLIGPALAAKSAHPRVQAVANHLRFLAAKGRRRVVQATKRLGLHGTLKALQRRIRPRGRR